MHPSRPSIQRIHFRPSFEFLECRLVPAGPQVFNTGVDAGGNLLADGAVDSHYSLISSADPSASGPNAYIVDQAPMNPIPPWYADGPASKWIGPQALQNVGNATGQYDYRTTVNLTGFVASTASLSGQAATDNFLIDILVNGVSTGINESVNQFGSPTPYSIDGSYFHSGVNRLDFIVFNGGTGVNPTGFRNEMTVTAQPTPTDQFAVSSDSGGTSIINFYNSDGTFAATANPFPGFTGGIRTAFADVNGDGIPDLIAGTGPGITAEVKILNGKTGATLFDVQPFDAFQGGLFVAAGDVDGDGIADLIISPDLSGGPRVEVYRGGDFLKIANFFGIDDPNFRGGARVSAGDLNGDGFADLIVAAGYSGGPRVSIFDGAALLQRKFVHPIGDFFAFEESLRNGVYVAVGDVNGNGRSDLIFGAGPGGGPRVLVVSGEILIDLGAARALQNPLANLFAGDPNNRGGVRVVAKNFNGDKFAEVVAGAGQSGGSGVAAYSGQALSAGYTTSLFGFDVFPGFTGGVFVG